jgi:hypothetical protein
MLKKRRTNAVYQIGAGLLESIREALVAEFIKMRFGIKTTDVGAAQAGGTHGVSRNSRLYLSTTVKDTDGLRLRI